MKDNVQKIQEALKELYVPTSYNGFVKHFAENNADVEVVKTLINRLILNNELEHIFKVKCIRCNTVIAGGTVRYDISNQQLIKNMMIGQNNLFNLRFRCSNCGATESGQDAYKCYCILSQLIVPHEVGNWLNRFPDTMKSVHAAKNPGFFQVHKIIKHLKDAPDSGLIDQDFLLATKSDTTKTLQLLYILIYEKNLPITAEWTFICPNCLHTIASGYAKPNLDKQAPALAMDIGGAKPKYMNLICPYCSTLFHHKKDHSSMYLTFHYEKN